MRELEAARAESSLRFAICAGSQFQQPQQSASGEPRPACAALTPRAAVASEGGAEADKLDRSLPAAEAGDAEAPLGRLGAGAAPIWETTFVSHSYIF
jgi:hypothetical protein